MTLKNAAKKLGCSEQTVKRYCKTFNIEVCMSDADFERLKNKVQDLGRSGTVGRPYGSYDN